MRGPSSSCKSLWLTSLSVAVALMACPAIAADKAPDKAPATESAEASAAADQAFKDYDAKKYRLAAQGFQRAYELSGAKFPRQLRNAAKALYAGGFLEEALETWARIESVAGPELELRTEAKEQIFKLRAELAGQAQQQAEAARRGKQHSQAGDQYARGYAVSGSMRTDLLIASAESYDAAGRLDDAHLAWTLAATALAAQPEAQRSALSGQDRLVARLRKLPGAESGYAAYQEKRWDAAAADLLRLYDTARERGHLRHAALALEAAHKSQDAESGWTRYEQAAAGSRLAVAEAQRRLALIRSERLIAEAKAATEAGRHAAAADKWLAVYELGKGRNAEALREAALAFEMAGDADRAKTWFERLRDSESAPEPWRREAAEHLANGCKPKAVVAPVKPPTDVTTPPVGVAKPAESSSCTVCLAAMGGGAVMAAIGGVLVGLAHSAQTELTDALAKKDPATGKINGTTYAQAGTVQQANVTRNNIGVGLLASGLVVAAAGGVLQWLQPSAPGQVVMVLALDGSGGIALWSGRF